MRTITNPYGYATPLGQAASRIAGVFAAMPDKRELEYLQARTDKAAIEAQALRDKARGTQTIAGVFADAYKPRPEASRADPTDVGPLPQMAGGEYARTLAPRLMEGATAAGIDAKDIGTLMYQLYGAAGASDAERARAYPGLIGVNDGVSLTDRDAVAARNAAAEKDLQLSKIFASPHNVAAGATAVFAPEDPRAAGGPVQGRDTESTATARLLADNFGNLAELDPYQRQALGANPSTSSATPRNYVRPDGGQGITLDGLTDAATNELLPQGSRVYTGQLQGNAAETGLTNPTQNEIQKRQVDLGVYQTFSQQYRTALQQNPGVSGTRGNIARLADSLLGQVEQIAPESEVAVSLRAARDSGSVAPDLYTAQSLASLLPFVAASAVVGQSGRSLSDEDRRIITNAVGAPDDWLATDDKLIKRLGTLDSVVAQLAQKYQGIADGGIGNAFALPGGGAPAVDAPAAQPVPPDLANEPDGTIVEDDQRRRFEKRGGQLIPVQ